MAESACPAVSSRSVRKPEDEEDGGYDNDQELGAPHKSAVPADQATQS
jgi:hypothetical protein